MILHILGFSPFRHIEYSLFSPVKFLPMKLYTSHYTFALPICCQLH